ncbi:hypothetical protein HY967_03300 [Candidatus Jorgensenbacteria bacterium]|nr:hypothetical protein [Candidatus Jorgensenbacteria bacterium]
MNDRSLIKRIVLTVWLLIGTFLGGGVAYADQGPAIYFTSDVSSVGPGSEFVVAVRIDSSFPINALDLTVHYPADLIDIVRVDNTGSVVSLWQETPRTNKEGFIKLSGGLFEPFQGNGGDIVRFYVRARSAGVANFQLTKTSLFIADGRGTELEASSLPLTISIVPGAPLSTTPSPVRDTTPPLLRAEIIVSPVDEKTPFVAFLASDNESGIGYTFMRIKRWFVWGAWQEVSSPVPVSSGAWTLELKAVNGSGEETIEILYSSHGIVNKMLMVIFGIVFLVLAVKVGILSYKRYNKKK